MIPEKEFDKWWHAAFNFGYYLGMTRAAEIVESYGNEMLSGDTDPLPSSYVAIILTERDKEEK